MPSDDRIKQALIVAGAVLAGLAWVALLLYLIGIRAGRFA